MYIPEMAAYIFAREQKCVICLRREHSASPTAKPIRPNSTILQLYKLPAVSQSVYYLMTGLAFQIKYYLACIQYLTVTL